MKTAATPAPECAARRLPDSVPGAVADAPGKGGLSSRRQRKMRRAAAALQAPPVYTDIVTPLGPMRLAAHDDALCGAWFLDQDDLPAPDGWLAQAVPVLRQAEAELRDWFAGRRQQFEVALRPHGTPFQMQVWRALCELPFGTLASYGELARHIGRPRAVRAVGGAVGGNPISVFIPCHRIVGHDTSLTGFGGGLPRKRALLAHEGHRYSGRVARARRADNGQLALPMPGLSDAWD